MTDTTLFDDTGSPNQSSQYLTNDNPLAQSFSSGSSAVTLTDVKVMLADTNPGDGGTVTIQLFSDSSGAPGSEVASLGTVSDSSLSTSLSLIDVPISSGPTLTANTEYWIEVTSNSSNTEFAYTNAATGTGVSSQSGDFGGTILSNFLAVMSVAGSLCFVAGTRILTARGEVPVEDLKPGDLAVALLGGRLAPVRWIGQRRVDLRAHPQPQDINPVRVRAHAFGQGRPQRDLILSPNHAIYDDGALIPVRYLLNGATIVQEAWDSADYYHVELDTHDVLLADGLPAESFLDAGNRAAFANGGAAVQLHPDFEGHVEAARGCAPRLGWGREVEALRQTLLDQAEALGHTRTADPNLHVLAGGSMIAPHAAGDELSFDLPEGARTVRLVSRSASPNDTRAENCDGRRLGVGITFLALDGQALAHDSAQLAEGWHEPEPALRWTKGDATLHTGCARTLTLRLHPGMTYWAESEDPPAARRCA